MKRLFPRGKTAVWLASLALCTGGIALRGQEKAPKLFSYYGKTPVLDGVLSPGEWSDATEYRGAKDWFPAFHAVTDDSDLSIKGYVKHDADAIYFAADVTDNLLYGIETERFLPDFNPKAHELTRDGFPWLGDEMEILLTTRNPPEAVKGNGSSWQMVCNLTKSHAGGVGKGGILEGEPRTEQAWAFYTKWIDEGAQQCVAKPKPDGKGYILEWAIRFKPCMEVEPGKFYSPKDGPAEMRIKLVLGDLDRKEDGIGNRFNFRHEQWYAPGVELGANRAWGYLDIMGLEKKPADRK